MASTCLLACLALGACARSWAQTLPGEARSQRRRAALRAALWGQQRLAVHTRVWEGLAAAGWAH
jgi:hypothetical protein